MNTDSINKIQDKDKNHSKQTTIIVNGRNKTWNEKTISFQQVVELAFSKYEDTGVTAYTVTYKKGDGNKPEGSMVKDEIIHVKDKMIFNVTATNKS